MIEFLRQIKAHVVLSAVLTIAFGIILILYPTTIPVLVCRLIGAALIVMGVIGFIAFLLSDGYQRLFIIGALLIIVLGLWFITHPTAALSLVPIIVGVIMIYHGIGDLSLWRNARTIDLDHQGVYLIVALVSIILGLFCIFAAIRVIELGMILIGIFLIFDGLSDLIVGINVGRGNRAYTRNFNENEPIDVDYEESDPDETL